MRSGGFSSRTHRYGCAGCKKKKRIGHRYSYTCNNVVITDGFPSVRTLTGSFEDWRAEDRKKKAGEGVSLPNDDDYAGKFFFLLDG